MKKCAIFPAVFAVLFLISCAAVQKQEKPEPVHLLSIDGTVQSVSGKEATLLLSLPELTKTPGSPIGDIARQVVQKSIFLEGMKTGINGKPALIREVRGNMIKAEFEGPVTHAQGTVLKIDVPKKTIAIVDFEVIKGREKEVGRVTLEGLTSALIDSGQFIVVERSKLKTVMQELQLSSSGMTREAPEKTIGKLLFADIILTGTLAEMRGEWDINLRLLNTRTGQAMSAITMKTNLFKPSEIRDAGQLNEDFETAFADPSWILIRFGKTAYYQISLDRSTGAEASQKSLRIDFNFVQGMRPNIGRVENRKKRDLSFYDGIEFYAKATDTYNAYFSCLTSHPDDPNKIDAWSGFFNVAQNWERYRIPFNNMFVARRWIKGGASMYGAKPGDQIMRLDRVEGFFIGLQQQTNGDVRGSLWIDKVRFYND